MRFARSTKDMLDFGRTKVAFREIGTGTTVRAVQAAVDESEEARPPGDLAQCVGRPAQFGEHLGQDGMEYLAGLAQMGGMDRFG